MKLNYASILAHLRSLHYKLTNSCYRTLHPASQDIRSLMSLGSLYHRFWATPKKNTREKAKIVAVME